MAHYWLPNEHPQLREMAAVDWLEDLAEFSPDIVEEACQDYRRSSDANRRPIPHDIRKRCFELQHERNERFQITAARQEAWPQWLEDIWGPAPEGPKARAMQIVKDIKQKADAIARLHINAEAREAAFRELGMVEPVDENTIDGRAVMC
jgi:hypothetical protein